MKKFAIFFSIALVFTGGLLLASCGEKIDLESLSFTQSEVEVFKGGSFFLKLNIFPEDANDFSVVWETSDKNVATVNRRGNVQSHDYGTAVITCRVENSDIKATCNVYVTDGMVYDMYVDENSVIKDYYEGQSFNKTSLSVWARYQSGVNRQLSEKDYQVVVPDVLNIGDSVKVVYKNFTYVVPLNVMEDYIASIEVTTPPNKTSYFIGESFDSSGMEVSAVYASGKKEKITDYTTNSTFTYKDNSVTVSYQDFTTSYPLTLSPKYTVSLYSDLQSIIDSASYGDSILITGSHFNVDSIYIPKSKNLTIFGRGNSITPKDNSPAFIIVDDTTDDNHYTTTIADLNLIAKDTNTSPLIVQEEGLKNLDLKLEGLKLYYNSSAVDISSMDTSETNIENISLSILDCNFVNNLDSQNITSNAINLENINNITISITDGNIIDASSIVNNNCQNLKIYINDQQLQ